LRDFDKDNHGVTQKGSPTCILVKDFEEGDRKGQSKNTE